MTLKIISSGAKDVIGMTGSTREWNSIDNRKTRFPSYFATYLEEDDVGPRRRNERRTVGREDEESGGRRRERKRETEGEKERGPWRCSLVARSTNCQVIGPVPPLV